MNFVPVHHPIPSLVRKSTAFGGMEIAELHDVFLVYLL
jgi:hypothetical protein